MKLKADKQVVVWSALFLSGFFARGFTEGDQIPFKEIIAGLVTLVAAYAGAKYAFKLQNDRAEKEVVKENVAAANRAVYTLYELWYTQKGFQKNIIEPDRGDNAWLHISPTVPGLHGLIKFDVENLDFLLNEGDPGLYVKLLLQEKRFRIGLSLIEERSNLVFNDLHPKMEELGIEKGSDIEIGRLEADLGPGLTNKLKVITNDLVRITDENVSSIEELYIELRSYLGKILPDKKLITVNFSESSETP